MLHVRNCLWTNKVQVKTSTMYDSDCRKVVIVSTKGLSCERYTDWYHVTCCVLRALIADHMRVLRCRSVWFICDQCRDKCKRDWKKEGGGSKVDDDEDEKLEDKAEDGANNVAVLDHDYHREVRTTPNNDTKQKEEDATGKDAEETEKEGQQAATPEAKEDGDSCSSEPIRGGKVGGSSTVSYAGGSRDDSNNITASREAGNCNNTRSK